MSLRGMSSGNVERLEEMMIVESLRLGGMK